MGRIKQARLRSPRGRTAARATARSTGEPLPAARYPDGVRMFDGVDKRLRRAQRAPSHVVFNSTTLSRALAAEQHATIAPSGGDAT